MMQNLLFVHLDHLCFEQTIYNNIDGQGDHLCLLQVQTTYVPGPNISWLGFGYETNHSIKELCSL